MIVDWLLLHGRSLAWHEDDETEFMRDSGSKSNNQITTVTELIEDHSWKPQQQQQQQE